MTISLTLCLMFLPATTDGDIELKRFVTSGSVKALASGEDAGKKFTARDKKGNIEVKLTPDTLLEVHEISSLGDLDGGSTIHVLARKQAEQLGTGGARYPPMLVQIQALVAGSFRPPAVTGSNASQGLVWVSGTLKSVENGREREVDGFRVGTSLGTELLKLTRVKSSALKKRRKIFLSGYMDDSDRKNRKLEAVEVLVLAPRWKKYETTHDLSKRLPPIKKKVEGEEETPPEDDDLPF